MEAVALTQAVFTEAMTKDHVETNIMLDTLRIRKRNLAEVRTKLLAKMNPLSAVTFAEYMAEFVVLSFEFVLCFNDLFAAVDEMSSRVSYVRQQDAYHEFVGLQRDCASAYRALNDIESDRTRSIEGGDRRRTTTCGSFSDESDGIVGAAEEMLRLAILSKI